MENKECECSDGHPDIVYNATFCPVCEHFNTICSLTDKIKDLKQQIKAKGQEMENREFFIDSISQMSKERDNILHKFQGEINRFCKEWNVGLEIETIPLIRMDGSGPTPLVKANIIL